MKDTVFYLGLASLFGVDLSTTTDIFGRSWYWYARSFDPVFLDPPLWLRIMCTIDAYVFGACYLVFIFAFVKGRNWVRIPALLYGSAIVYSTIVYFSWEFLDEANRAQANLLAVFVVNIPYTVVVDRPASIRPRSARSASSASRSRRRLLPTRP